MFNQPASLDYQKLAFPALVLIGPELKDSSGVAGSPLSPLAFDSSLLW